MLIWHVHLYPSTWWWSLANVFYNCISLNQLDCSIALAKFQCPNVSCWTSGEESSLIFLWWKETLRSHGSCIHANLASATNTRPKHHPLQFSPFPYLAFLLHLQNTNLRSKGRECCMDTDCKGLKGKLLFVHRNKILLILWNCCLPPVAASPWFLYSSGAF